MLMEDASAEAILIEKGRDQPQLKIEMIRASASDAATLASAALVVLRRSGPPSPM
jgi:hypothetical protein